MPVKSIFRYHADINSLVERAERIADVRLPAKADVVGCEG